MSGLRKEEWGRRCETESGGGSERKGDEDEQEVVSKYFFLH